MRLVRFERKMLKQFDWLLLLIVISLSLLSILLLASVMTQPYAGGEMGFFGALDRIDFRFATRQGIWFLTGMCWLIGFQFLDYKIYGELTHYIYWINIAALSLTLLLSRGGQVAAWLTVFEDTTIQPSEFGKVAIILTFGNRLARREKPIQTVWELLVEVAYVGLPTAIIVLQNDYGTAIVYVAIFIGMLFVSGINLKLMIGMAASAAVAAVPIWMILPQWRKDRFLVFFDLNSVDTSNEGYQILQALRALGSGKLTGKGMFAEGTVVQQGFLPVKLSDFIFSSVGETMGFVGCMAVIALYIVMLMRIVRISMKARDAYGTFIAMGVAFMFFAHIFENIAMTIKMMPMTGIPLPFLSYGGTSFWANMMAVGLVLSIGMRRSRAAFPHN